MNKLLSLLLVAAVLILPLFPLIPSGKVTAAADTPSVDSTSISPAAYPGSFTTLSVELKNNSTTESLNVRGVFGYSSSALDEWLVQLDDPATWPQGWQLTSGSENIVWSDYADPAKIPFDTPVGPVCDISIGRSSSADAQFFLKVQDGVQPGSYVVPYVIFYWIDSDGNGLQDSGEEWQAIQKVKVIEVKTRGDQPFVDIVQTVLWVDDNHNDRLEWVDDNNNGKTDSTDWNGAMDPGEGEVRGSVAPGESFNITLKMANDGSYPAKNIKAMFAYQTSSGSSSSSSVLSSLSTFLGVDLTTVFKSLGASTSGTTSSGTYAESTPFIFNSDSVQYVQAMEPSEKKGELVLLEEGGVLYDLYQTKHRIIDYLMYRGAPASVEDIASSIAIGIDNQMEQQDVMAVVQSILDEYSQSLFISLPSDLWGLQQVPGETLLTFSATAKDSITTSKYNIPVLIAFQNDAGADQPSVMDMVGIQIKGEARFAVSGLVTTPSSVSKGQPFALEVTLGNIGSIQVSSVRVFVAVTAKDTDQPNWESVPYYAGTVKAGDMPVALFILVAPTPALDGSVNVYLKVEYLTDPQGAFVQDTLQAKMKISPAKGSSLGPLLLRYAAILAIVAVVVLLIWRWRRNKRRGEEEEVADWGNNRPAGSGGHSNEALVVPARQDESQVQTERTDLAVSAADLQPQSVAIPPIAVEAVVPPAEPVVEAPSPKVNLAEARESFLLGELVMQRLRRADVLEVPGPKVDLAEARESFLLGEFVTQRLQRAEGEPKKESRMRRAWNRMTWKARRTREEELASSQVH